MYQRSVLDLSELGPEAVEVDAQCISPAVVVRLAVTTKGGLSIHSELFLSRYQAHKLASDLMSASPMPSLASAEWRDEPKHSPEGISSDSPADNRRPGWLPDSWVRRGV